MVMASLYELQTSREGAMKKTKLHRHPNSRLQRFHELTPGQASHPRGTVLCEHSYMASIPQTQAGSCNMGTGTKAEWTWLP